MRKTCLAFAFVLGFVPFPCVVTTTALAQEGGTPPAAAARSGDLEISAGYARAMLPGQPAGGAYLSITNRGAEPDRLVSAASPAAGRVELHTMEIVNDIMVMRPLKEGFEIAPGKTVALQPGGKHLMFMEVSAPFKEGTSVAVVLAFEKAGEVEISLPVRSAGGGADHSGHGASN